MDVRRWWANVHAASIKPIDNNIRSGVEMSTAVPATFLVILGALLAVLGLFAAGNLAVVVVGLLAIFGAGLLTLAETRR